MPHPSHEKLPFCPTSPSHRLWVLAIVAADRRLQETISSTPHQSVSPTSSREASPVALVPLARTSNLYSATTHPFPSQKGPGITHSQHRNRHYFTVDSDPTLVFQTSIPNPLISSEIFRQILMPFEKLPNTIPDRVAKISERYMLYIRSDRQRFPVHIFMEDLATDVEGRYRELNFPCFSSSLFFECWTGPSISLHDATVYCHPEHEFRGAKWRLYPLRSCLHQRVTRGTVFDIGNIDNSGIEVKYMASICRAVTDTHALIQLNAYTEFQQRLHPHDEKWPTLTVVIPLQFNAVPLIHSQSKYYLNTIKRELHNSVIFPNGFVL